MNDNCIDFVIRIPVSDHNDFHSLEFLAQLKEWSEKSFGDTKWEPKVFHHHHYPDEYKLIWCDACQGETSHVSVDGEDFRCVFCEYNGIRNIILNGAVDGECRM